MAAGAAESQLTSSMPTCGAASFYQSAQRMSPLRSLLARGLERPRDRGVQTIFLIYSTPLKSDLRRHDAPFHRDSLSVHCVSEVCSRWLPELLRATQCIAGRSGHFRHVMDEQHGHCPDRGDLNMGASARTDGELRFRHTGARRACNRA